LLSIHNVPYVLQCIRDIFPHHESGPNKLTCSASTCICLPHFLNDSDLLHKQAAPLSGKASPFPSHRQVLANKVNRQ